MHGHSLVSLPSSVPCYGTAKIFYFLAVASLQWCVLRAQIFHLLKTAARMYVPINGHQLLMEENATFEIITMSLAFL